LTDNQKHNDYIATGQRVNRQTSRPYVFYFFLLRIFLKTILSSRTSGTFGMAPTHNASPSAKLNEPFFNQPSNILLTEINFQNLNSKFIINYTIVQHTYQFNQNN